MRDRLRRIGVSRFNEAAAYHCGKREKLMGIVTTLHRSFNEAAAYHCGKR